MSNEGITFNASFYKAQTLMDGGIRISFDLPETEAGIIAKMLAVKGYPLTVAVVAEEQ